MPTVSEMRPPIPKSANEFEEICVDVLSQKYGTIFQRFGRSGQCQDGIDLYSDNFKIVAQCKNYQNYSSIIKDIKKDFDRASKHFDLQKFIVATTLNRDTTTQLKISEIAQKGLTFFAKDLNEIMKKLNY